MTFDTLLSDDARVSVLALYSVTGVLTVIALATTLLCMTRLPKTVRWLLGFPLLFAAVPVVLLLGDSAAAEIGLSVPAGRTGMALAIAIGVACVLNVAWLRWGLNWAFRIPAPATSLTRWPAPQLTAALAKVPIADARTEVDSQGCVSIDIDLVKIQPADVEIDDLQRAYDGFANSAQFERVFRFELELDEVRHRVRVTETLIPSLKQRGPTIGQDLRWVVDLLREMTRSRGQLQQLVARAGWDWQPVLANLPPWLRRLLYH